MDESINNPTRRRFLALAGGVLSVSGCSSSSPVTAASLGDVMTVTAASLANPSLEPVGTMPVCIGRDSKGIYAMTLTCTHMGCNIGTGTVSPQGLRCPCHGSTYDANGNVTGGPAPAPLQHFAVTADASGVLTIHTGQNVSADMRLTGI
jgi:nitrite reductase/ring-hydroxylating ferredoxin subunit